MRAYALEDAQELTNVHTVGQLVQLVRKHMKTLKSDSLPL